LKIRYCFSIAVHGYIQLDANMVFCHGYIIYFMKLLRDRTIFALCSLHELIL